MDLTTSKKIYNKDVIQPGMLIQYRANFTDFSYTNAIIEKVTEETLYIIRVEKVLGEYKVKHDTISIIESSANTISIIGNNKAFIQIEDFYGNTLMDFTINSHMEVVSSAECEVAEIEDDGPRNRKIIRIQSTRENILTDSKFNSGSTEDKPEVIKTTPYPKTFRDMHKSSDNE